MELLTTAVGLKEGGLGQLIQVKNFRLVWTAQMSAQLAERFLMLSLVILAYHLSATNTSVAVILLAYTIPAVLMAPLAGVIADRYDRKRVMMIANAARAVLVILIPISSWIPLFQGDFFHLLLITFAFAGVGQLFAPAEAAAIPTLISRRQLMAANSLMMGTTVVSWVIGAAMGPIISGINLYAPYWIAAVLLAAAVFIVGIASFPSSDSGGQTRAEEGALAQLVEGWKVLAKSPILRLSFGQLSLVILLLFTTFTLAPSYVSRVVGISADDSSIILAPAALGCLVGALALGVLRRKTNRWQLVGGALGIAGVTLLAMIFLPELLHALHDVYLIGWVVGILAFLLGLEFGGLLIPAFSDLMEFTDDRIRGRIFALVYMTINGVSVIPVLAASILADLIGTSRVVIIIGVCLLLLAGVVLIRGRRRLTPIHEAC
ncbi:MAG: MFS transporter [Candidatus Dormibacteraceae bacterium]